MRKPWRKFRRAGRGAILLISILFALSALIRVGSGAGYALADALTQDRDAPVPLDSKNKSKERLRTGEHSDINRGDIGGLLSALTERERRVREMEAQLAKRTEALGIVDEEVSKRLKALEQAELNLRNTLALANGAAEKDLARLTAVYENMKPKDAAALFAAMEPAFAAGFLGRMRPDAAAAIMTGLPPEAAYSISVILAGRNANAPKT